MSPAHVPTDRVQETPMAAGERPPLDDAAVFEHLVRAAEQAADRLRAACGAERNGDPIHVAAHEDPVRREWWSSGVPLTRIEESADTATTVPVSPVAAIVKEVEDAYEAASIGLRSAQEGAWDAVIRTLLPRLNRVRTQLQQISVTPNGKSGPDR